MKSLIIITVVCFFSIFAKAEQLVCKDSNQNANVYVKKATVTNSNITLTLNDGSVINGMMFTNDQMGSRSLDEQTSAKINLEVTLASREGQTMLLVNPLMSMEIPQILLCE